MLEIQAQSKEAEKRVKDLSGSFEDFNDKVHKSSANYKKFGKSVDGVSQSFSKGQVETDALRSRYDSLAVQIATLNMPSFNKQILEVAKSSRSMSSSSMDIAITTVRVNKELKASSNIAGRSSRSIDGLGLAFDKTSESAKTLNSQLSKQGNVLERIDGGVNNILLSAHRLIDTISDIAALITTLTDPKVLARIAGILKIFGAFAHVKGAGELGNVLFSMSDSLTEASTQLISIHAEIEALFNEAVKQAELFHKSLFIAKAAIIGLGATLGALTFSGLVGGINEVRKTIGKTELSLLSFMRTSARNLGFFIGRTQGGFLNLRNDIHDSIFEINKVIGSFVSTIMNASKSGLLFIRGFRRGFVSELGTIIKFTSNEFGSRMERSLTLKGRFRAGIKEGLSEAKDELSQLHDAVIKPIRFIASAVQSQVRDAVSKSLSAINNSAFVTTVKTASMAGFRFGKAFHDGFASEMGTVIKFTSDQFGPSMERSLTIGGRLRAGLKEGLKEVQGEISKIHSIFIQPIVDVSKTVQSHMELIFNKSLPILTDLNKKFSSHGKSLINSLSALFIGGFEGLGSVASKSINFLGVQFALTIDSMENGSKDLSAAISSSSKQISHSYSLLRIVLKDTGLELLNVGKTIGLVSSQFGTAFIHSFIDTVEYMVVRFANMQRMIPRHASAGVKSFKQAIGVLTKAISSDGIPAIRNYFNIIRYGGEGLVPFTNFLEKASKANKLFVSGLFHSAKAGLGLIYSLGLLTGKINILLPLLNVSLVSGIVGLINGFKAVGNTTKLYSGILRGTIFNLDSLRLILGDLGKAGLKPFITAVSAAGKIVSNFAFDVLIDFAQMGAGIRKNLASLPSIFSSAGKSASSLGPSLKGAMSVIGELGMTLTAGLLKASIGSVERIRTAFASLQGNVAPHINTFKGHIISLTSTIGENTGKVVSIMQAFGRGFVQGVKNPIAAVASGISNAKTIISGFGESLIRTSPSFLSITEGGVLLAPILLTLGGILMSTDNQLLKFLGTMTLVATIMLTGFATAVSFLAHAIGGLAVRIGDNLLNVMAKFESKAAKFQEITNLMTFTIKGFGREMGVEAVGSVERWSAVMDKVNKTTAFTSDEIAKSIKILVAEGAALGIAVNDIENMLTRSVDVAAATGKDLSDVTERIAKAMTGQADGLSSMGIMVGEAAVNHSHFAHELNKTTAQMTKQELVQARVNTLFENTAAFVGASAVQMETINGANKRYEKTIQDIEIRLGQQSVATMTYINTLTDLAIAFVRLPGPIITVIGTSIDFLGVTLKILGTILQYSILILGLKASFGFLQMAITKFISVQNALNSVFTVTGRIFQTNMLQVTSLREVLINLARVVKSAIIPSLRGLAVALWEGTVAVTAFTKSLLLNPIFIKYALIAGAIILIVSAIRELAKEFSFVSDTIKETGGWIDSLFNSTSILTKGWEALKDVAARAFRVLVDLVKLAIIPLVRGTLGLVGGFTLVQKAFAGSAEAATKYDKTLSTITKNLEEVDNVQKITLVDMAKQFDSTALAAEKSANATKEHAKASKKLGDELAKLKDSGSISDMDIKIQELGDTFEKTINAFEASNIQFNRVLDKSVNTIEEAQKREEELKTLREETIRRFLQMQKMQSESVLELAKQKSQAEIESLKNQGKLVEAAGLEGAARSQELEKMIQGLEKLSKATGTPLKNLKEMRDVIEAQNKAGIEAARKQEQEKSQERAIDAFEKLKEQSKALRDELAMVNKTQLEAITISESRALAEIDAMEKQLASLDALKGREAELQAAREAVKAKALVQRNDATGGAPEATVAPIQAATMGLAQAFAPMMAGPLAAASTLMDVAQGIVDFIPNLLSKFSNLVNSLTQLPLKILEGITGVFDAVLSFVANLIPNLIKAIEGILDGLVSFLENLPDVFAKMLDSLPAMITRLMDKLPQIAEKLIVALITLGPKLMASWMVFLIKDAPKMAIKWIKILAVEMPKAIIEGIKEAAKVLIGLVSGMASGAVSNVGDKINESFKKVATAVTGKSSQLFQLSELAASAKGSDLADRIRDSISSSTRSAASYLERLWEKIMNALRAVWEWVIGILKKAWEFLGQVWDGLVSILKSVFEVIVAHLKATWDAIVSFLKSTWDNMMVFLTSVWDNVVILFKDMVSFLTVVWDVIIENLRVFWDFIVTVFKAAWDVVLALFDSVIANLKAVWQFVIDLFTNVIDFFKNIWQVILDLFQGKINLFEAIGRLFKAVFEFAGDILQSVATFFKSIFSSAADLFSRVWDNLKNIFSSAINGITTAFEGVGRIFSAAIDGIKSAFQVVGNMLHNAVQAIARTFENVGQLFSSLIDGFKNAFAGFARIIGDFLKPITEAGSRIWEGLRDGITNGLGSVLNAINPANILGKIFQDPGGEPGTVERMLGINIPIVSFAGGGYVPGKAQVPGDSAVNDKILSLLSPGEFVIPRSIAQDKDMQVVLQRIAKGDAPQKVLAMYSFEQFKKDTGLGKVMGNMHDRLWEEVKNAVFGLFNANRFHTGGLVGGNGDTPIMAQSGEFVVSRPGVDAFGLGGLQAINKGKGAGSNVQQTFNIEIKIEAKTPIDEAFIRNRLKPALVDMLRRDSLDGKRVLAKAGIS